ncbi:MAG: hypothetical protein BGN88_01860 [Clostridiales bacterium 43-6]|nr:MAG: hypothetical protein BGN88_01860 [Clostridiales bacterium 43-6]
MKQKWVRLIVSALIVSLCFCFPGTATAQDQTKNLSSDIYDLVNATVLTVEAGTLVTDFLCDIRVKQGYTANIYEKNTVTSQTVIGTGMRLVCLNASSSVTEAYDIAVIGDTSGDGFANVIDMVSLKKYVLKISSPTAIQFVSVNFNGDKTVNILDMVVLKRWILKIKGLPPASNTKEVTNMYTASVANEGYKGRIAEAMKKAERGENITIGFIGGSVTYGSDTGYAVLVANWWKTKFPGKVTVVNAGISGTSSVFGVARADNDIIAKNCDFVIVEYAVNDYDELCGLSYEGLIRKILKSSRNPGILSLFMSYYDNGAFSNIQSIQLPTVQQYHIPAISYMQALQYRVTNEPGFDPAPLFKDIVHQNQPGDAMAADLVIHQLEKIYQKQGLLTVDSSALANPLSISTVDFENAKLYSSSNLTPKSQSGFSLTNSDSWVIWQTKWNNPVSFPKAWSGKAGNFIEFEVDCSVAYIVYHASTGSTPPVDIFVDGTKLLQSSATGGSYAFKLIVPPQDKAVHTVRLEVPATFAGSFMLDGLIAG